MKQEETTQTNNSSHVKDMFLGIFVLITILLCATLYISYRVNNSNDLSFQKDIFHLRADIQSFKINTKESINGFMEIKEIKEGVNISGEVRGLTNGSTHGVHILEYADLSFITNLKASTESDYLKHYNPYRIPHGCPSINNDDFNIRPGDFGNIIADNKGIAKFSLIKKINLNSLTGRLLIISKFKDNCDPVTDHDKLNEIIALGSLSITKPTMEGYLGNNNKDDYTIRELNTHKTKKIVPIKNNFTNNKEVHIFGRKLNLIKNKLKVMHTINKPLPKLKGWNHNVMNNRNYIINKSHKPLFTQHKPLFTQHKPIFTPYKPIFTQHKPLFTQHKPIFTPQKSFIPGKPTVIHVPHKLNNLHKRIFSTVKSFVPHKPTVIQHKPLFTQNKPLAISRKQIFSPVKSFVPHKPSVIQHKPLFTKNKPLAISRKRIFSPVKSFVPHKPTVIQHNRTNGLVNKKLKHKIMEDKLREALKKSVMMTKLFHHTKKINKSFVKKQAKPIYHPKILTHKIPHYVSPKTIRISPHPAPNTINHNGFVSPKTLTIGPHHTSSTINHKGLSPINGWGNSLSQIEKQLEKDNQEINHENTTLIQTDEENNNNSDDEDEDN